MRSALSPLEPQQVRAPFGLCLDGERLDRSGETLGLTSKFKGGDADYADATDSRGIVPGAEKSLRAGKKTAFCPCGGGLVAARNHPPNPRNPRPPFEPGCLSPGSELAKVLMRLDDTLTGDHEHSVPIGGSDLRHASEIPERRQDAHVSA